MLALPIPEEQVRLPPVGGYRKRVVHTTGTYYVPGFGPSALRLWLHTNLTTAPKRRSHHLHLTDQQSCSSWLHSLEGPGLEFRQRSVWVLSITCLVLNEWQIVASPFYRWEAPGSELTHLMRKWMPNSLGRPVARCFSDRQGRAT